MVADHKSASRNLYYLLKGSNRIKYDAQSDKMVGYLNPDTPVECPVDTLLRTTRLEKPGYFDNRSTRDRAKPAPAQKNP